MPSAWWHQSNTPSIILPLFQEILDHIPFYLSQLWVVGLTNRERNLLEEYEVLHILRKTRELCSEWEKKAVGGWNHSQNPQPKSHHRIGPAKTQPQIRASNTKIKQTKKKKCPLQLIVILYLMECLLDHVSTCSSIIGLLISLLIFHQLVLEFPHYDPR